MSVETTRKLKMKFKTTDGDDRNITLSYVKDSLKEGTGAAQVKSAMQSVIANQPLEVEVSSMNGAQVIETTTTDVTFE